MESGSAAIVDILAASGCHHERVGINEHAAQRARSLAGSGAARNGARTDRSDDDDVTVDDLAAFVRQWVVNALG